jgi:hypothetical protein
MAIKKMIGRFIINLIKDPMMVLAASIILGVFEILSVTTLAVSRSCAHPPTAPALTPAAFGCRTSHGAHKTPPPPAVAVT